MRESYFDGGLLFVIWLSISNFFIVVFTFGICTPWAITRSYKWEIEHSVVDGKRLVFDGKAINLFAHWLKWMFLTLITLGIYSFWVKIKVLEWKTKHTHTI